MEFASMKKPRDSQTSRKSKKPLHFRDEIRTAFISYAFIPVAALFVLITLCAGIIWSVSINRKAEGDCNTICAVLEEAVENYMEKAAELSGRSNTPGTMGATGVEEAATGPDINRMKTDKNLVSEAYSTLKEFVRKQSIAANFAVVDNDFAVLLQGDSSQTFRIPSYQKEIEWGPLQRMAQNPGNAVLEISHEYSASALDEIIIGSAVVGGSGEQNSGYLIFAMTGKNVQDALRSISSPYVITDSFRNVFVTTNRYYLDDMNRLSSDYRTENGAISITGYDAVYRSDICGGSLSVYTIIDVSQMKKAVITLVLLAVILLVVLSVAMFVSGGKIAADKTRTIDELVVAFHDVEDGILENRVDIRGNVEFQTIGEAYNKMLDDIKRLIAENEKETKAKYISELKQLEMQFNPHFLYNTLATVRYLVKLDPDGAVRTVVSLSELLRYSLNSENSYVELAEDLKYIENYLAILETRFGSKFSFDIVVSDDCMDAVIPKLIVQPVIENAVKYGFEGVPSMRISVRAEKAASSGAQYSSAGESQLLLTISDTGSGMDEETLKQVQSLLSTPENATNHIGLFNVQRRIKLLYGEKYGLSVESGQGKGTVVRIRLPYRTASKGGRRDESNNR
ncbi:MAG: sensor histidine kinase [Spirochaetaceae bacterium]|nr:sensor histidine kinase [Spirochaetaceae bacterium]